MNPGLERIMFLIAGLSGLKPAIYPIKVAGFKYFRALLK
jgi:hypothetical protein